SGAPARNIASSPALAQLPAPAGPIAGRVIGVFVADGVDAAGERARWRGLGAGGGDALRHAVEGEGASMYVIGPHGGSVTNGKRALAVDRTAFSTQSVEYDALVVAG